MSKRMILRTRLWLITAAAAAALVGGLLGGVALGGGAEPDASVSLLDGQAASLTPLLSEDEVGTDPTRIDPATARLARTFPDRQVLAARVPSGSLGPLTCILVRGEAVDGQMRSCGSASSLSNGAIWLRHVSYKSGRPEATLYVLAPDGFTMATAGDRQVPIEDNVAVVENLALDAPSVTVSGPAGTRTISFEGAVDDSARTHWSPTELQAEAERSRALLGD